MEGLQKKDFLVAEDGHPQNITYFEEHTGAKAADASRLPPLPPNVFSNVPRARPSDAVTVLLLDSMNTQLQDQAVVHAQMLKYRPDFNQPSLVNTRPRPLENHFVYTDFASERR